MGRYTGSRTGRTSTSCFPHCFVAAVARAAAGLSLFILAPPGHARELEPIAQTVADINAVLRAEDAALGGARGVPLFIDGGRRFLYQEEGRGGMGVMLVDIPTGRVKPLAEPAVIRKALAAAGANPDVAELDGVSDDVGTLYFRIGERMAAFDRRTRRARFAPERDRWAEMHRPRVISDQFPQTYGDLVEAASPDGRSFITQRDGNLWLRDVGGGEHPLTSDASRDLIWGGTEESAQQFNVHWSPDGRKIATVLLDNRNVPHEPLAHYVDRRTRIENIPFSRVGEPISRFSLYAIDVATGARTPIDTGDTADHYVNLLGWSAKGDIYYQVVSRDQKSVEFYRADARSGASRRVAVERSNTYVDTPFSLGPQLLTPLKTRDGFLLFSERDGVRRLYLNDGSGGEDIRLGGELGLVTRIVAMDEKRDRLFVLAAAPGDRPYDTALYSLPLNGGAARRLTPGPGFREVWAAPDANGFVVRTSNPQTPPRVELVLADGGRITEVSRSSDAKLRGMGFSEPETFVARAIDDRFDVRGLILKPFDFDPRRRYPVVEMIYGGMQVSHTPKSYYGFGDLGAGYNSVPARILLHHGFVVVFVDAPGTPDRGRAYQDATYGIWPQTVVANHAKWLRDAARDRPWMDLNRVGIFGSSWGGYMSQRALADAPELYKVAVAMAAVADFDDHQMYIEPFMGLREQNPEGYAAASIYPRIPQIRGRILSIGFPLDINAGFSPTMKFVDAMAAADKDIDLFVLPRINHQVTCCDPHSATYTYAVITRYFRRWLGDSD